MVRARISYREPAAGTQRPRRFGEIPGREDAGYEIDGGIAHRPFGPQIGDSKSKHWPPPRSISRRSFGDIEANTHDRRCQDLRNSCKVMPCARAGVQDAPFPEYRLGIALLNVLHDRRRDRVEMAFIEECNAVAQLLWTIATRSGLASPASQKIDVAFAGQIEAMVITADECACRSG